MRTDLSTGDFGAGRVRKRRRGVALLPALFTLGNCLSGFASISFSARGLDPAPPFASSYSLAGYCIFVAMLFDMFDGFVARLTRSTSDFGAELDSLADMVSFGIAPAFLSIKLIGDLLHAQTPTGKEFLYFPGPFQDDAWLRLFWVIAGVYVSCTALRLARFNVLNKHDVGSHMNFRGIPSPGAGAVVAATVIFFEGLRTGTHANPFNVPEQMIQWLKAIFPYLVPVVLLISALLMVSRFAYSHLINRFMRGRKSFRTLVGFLLLAMIIVWQPQLSVVTAIYLYALSAPVMWLMGKATGKTRRATPIAPHQ